LEPIPDSWPPSEDEIQSLEVPMFPLQDIFLFPHQLMPLHVFEPRYKQMIEDSLDGPGRIVLGTVLDKDDVDMLGAPEVLEVAGLGEIARHEKLDDGRFLIWLFGLGRVRMQEIPSDEPYRRVRCEPLTEVDVADEDADRYRKDLTEAILARTEQFLNLPDDVPIGMLTDLLLQRMDLPQIVMEDIFVESNASTRAQKALRAHVNFPGPTNKD